MNDHISDPAITDTNQSVTDLPAHTQSTNRVPWLFFCGSLIIALVTVLCSHLISNQTLIVHDAQVPVKHIRHDSTKIAPDYTLPAAENGMVPVITRIPTTQKVVFLTIDDGAYKDKSVIDEMNRNHLKASLFLAHTFISSNPGFFKQLTNSGSVVENHTLSHDINMVRDQGYEAQRAEICGMSDYVEQQYGHRPELFRPPGGAYSDEMRRAAADCGMKAIITWEAKANGGAMQYQVGESLRPGDIVLMHFRPEFKDDMKAFIQAKNAAGLRTQLLEDWLMSDKGQPKVGD